MQILGGAAMLLFGGKRKGGATILAAKSIWRKVFGERQMTISVRLLKCCLFVSLLVALRPPVPPKLQTDVTSCVFQ